MSRQYINTFTYLRGLLIAALCLACFIICTQPSFAFDKATKGTQADSTIFNITGKVIDDSGQALPGATVFISNSKWAASTDAQGIFKLTGLPRGNYEVLVRMMGFLTFTKVIAITDRSVNIGVTLKTDAIALNEVNVKAKPDGNRARYLKTFAEVFIGESDNGKSSKIVNDDVIRFNNLKDAGTLLAHSTDFIKIQNSALGYNVYYLLKSFSYTEQYKSFAYDGNIFFEELKGDDKQQKEWAKNRLSAYYGSTQHFFRALFAGTTEEEGFKVYKIADSELGNSTRYSSLGSARLGVSSNAGIVNRINISSANLRPIKPESLYKTENMNKVLQIPLLVKDGDTTRFYVCYTRKGEPARFLNSGSHLNIPVQNAQISRIYQLNNNVILNKNGTLIPQQSILLDGFWGWQRVGDLLPEELIPQADVNTKKADIEPLARSGKVEKIHIQMDRPWYLKGDTAWMKVYVVDADNRPSADSKVCFVELIDANKRIVKNLRLPLNTGAAWGEIAFDSLLKKGAYLLRAYTANTLKNGNAFYYQTIRLADLNMATGKNPPAITNQQQWQAVADSLKVQFFPEGGSLVLDVNSRVALKVMALGKPANKVQGYIANEDGSHIAKFETNKMGVGAFNLKPLRQGKYWAVLDLGNGREKRFALPQPQQVGIGMALKQNEDNIIASLNAGNINSQTQFKLIVKANDKVQYQAEKVVLPAGDSIVISKAQLPQGILQFNLYNANNVIIAERMVYNQTNRQQLKVKVAPNKTVYKPHDKVDINIAITDAVGIPVSGNFSVLVNNEADLPDFGQNTILTDLLVGDRVNYDLAKLSADAARELDNVMLTVKPQNQRAASPQPAAKLPQDTSTALQGQVYTAKGKPAEPSVIGVYFPGGGPVLTTISDNTGKFQFNHIPVKRGESFYIVAKEKTGKELNIAVDKFTPPAITDEMMADTLKEYANEYIDFVGKRIEELKAANIIGTELKEVLIKDNKKAEPSLKELVQRSSSNIGGRPDQVLTFIDLLGCASASLGECLALKLYGVSVSVDTLHHATRLYARGRSTSPMAVYVDGIERLEALTVISSSAVASVEVLKGSNAAAYGLNSGNGVVVITTKKGEMDYWAYEQEHNVPGSTKTSPVQRYRFENGFDVPKDFYAPDYTTIQGSTIDKWRPTVYWNPDVNTANDGTAKLSYFTNAAPGNYLITIEGVDNNGRIARQVFKYTVSK